MSSSPLALLFIILAAGAFLFVAHVVLCRAVLARRDDVSPQKALVGLIAALNVPLTLAVAFWSRGGVAELLWALLYAAAVFNGFGYAYFHFFNLSETGRRIRLLMRMRESGTIRTASLENEYSADQMVRVRLHRLEQMGQIERDADGRHKIRGRLLLRAAKVLEIIGSTLFPRRAFRGS